MAKNKKLFIIGGLVSGLILVISFTISLTSVRAGTTLCSFKGPDLSNDLIQLTDFNITGPSSLKEGDTITVKFNLQNRGKTDLTLSQRGIFAASLNPDNLDASFGFSHTRTTFKAGQTLTVEVSRVLNKAGTWVIWPSYHLFRVTGEKLGPEKWRACSLAVGAKIIDSDQDGISDQQDNCPKNHNPKQEDIDKDGIGNACDPCDDRDSDGDRIKNCLDKCPDKPENYNQYQDDDGCPDEKPKLDSDQDGIADEKDKCPKEKETFNNYQDDDGCPDTVPIIEQFKELEPPKKEQEQKQEQQQQQTPQPEQQPEPEIGTPKAMPGEKLGTIIITLPSATGTRTATINSPTRESVAEGPIMPDAFKDGDNDGVFNIFDECPETPAGKLVFKNGCRCKDSDGGRNIWEKGTVSYYKDDGTIQNVEEYCIDRHRKIRERYCAVNAERLDIRSRVSILDIRNRFSISNIRNRVSIEEISCEYGCENGKCKMPEMSVMPRIIGETIIPLGACASGAATCADGIRNQDETGVDCGGKCAPCNSVCETPVKYAPPDTPCRSHFFGGGTYVTARGRRVTDVPNVSDEERSDQHRIELEWIEGGGECNCQFYEVCDPDIDFVIEEAQQCCSATSLEQIESMPDPNLCKTALRSANGNCKRCTGIYIIRGLGAYARWMQGYRRIRAMDHYVCGAWFEATPTERLINEHKTGICRDYSGALITLLRKAGYRQREVGNFCDGAHCYNVVKLPGDAKWHVIDTTGNWGDIRLGGLPGGYPYCFALNEENWCFNNTKTFDVDVYRENLRAGRLRFSTCVGRPGFVGNHEGYNYNFDRTYSVQCGLGVACGRDNYELPDFAPSIRQIVGCE